MQDTDVISTLSDQNPAHSTKKWYIIHTTPGYENKVKERLIKRASDAGMQSAIGDILIPTEEVIELKNGQKKTVSRRLFSGYVFIQLDFSDSVWHIIRKTANVTGFVGGTTRPSPMKQSEIDHILQRNNQPNTKPVPKVTFTEGEVLRICDGPFKDFNASVHQVDYDKGRLRVMVSVFGRETPLDLSFSDVEKV